MQSLPAVILQCWPGQLHAVVGMAQTNVAILKNIDFRHRKSVKLLFSKFDRLDFFCSCQYLLKSTFNVCSC